MPKSMDDNSKTFTERQFKSHCASSQIIAIDLCFKMACDARDSGLSAQAICNKLYEFKWKAFEEAKNEGLQVTL